MADCKRNEHHLQKHSQNETHKVRVHCNQRHHSSAFFIKYSVEFLNKIILQKHHFIPDIQMFTEKLTTTLSDVMNRKRLHIDGSYTQVPMVLFMVHAVSQLLVQKKYPQQSTGYEVQQSGLENLSLDHFAMETPFLLELMHFCLFTHSHLLRSSSCAKLILSEALTLSCATMSGGTVEKGAPRAAPSIQRTVWSQHTISQISSAMKKRTRGGGGKIKTEYACIKFNTFVPMATIQHVIHMSSCIRVDGVYCLGPGEHGCLEQTWPPLPPSDQHPGHSPHCYFSLIHIQIVFSPLITRQMTTMAQKKKGIMQCSTEPWLL